ncbi:MAG: class I SAM-dependent methyltransferase [Actinomycetota bacterium]
MTRDMTGPSMWDGRYDIDDYLFGTEPAAYLARHGTGLPAGAATLVVADGEGRNSVFLAEQGLAVTAVDVSPIGVAKAKALAERRGVRVDFRVADLLEWTWEPDAFDVVVAVFIQFLDPDQRRTVFDGMVRTLRPGGHLLVHGYRPEQLAYGTGGPPIAEYLYTEELLRELVGGLEIEVLHSHDSDIAEGTGHVGRSALIDLVARRPPAPVDCGSGY